MQIQLNTILIFCYAGFMKIISKKHIVKLICRKSFQKVMYKLHLFGLTGMNYGNANTLSFEQTGETNAIKFISNELFNEKEFIFFDVGANTGAYSNLIAEIFKGKNLSVYAFEPVKYTFSLLVSNTSGIKKIRHFNFGLGNKQEKLIIYSNYETSGATTLYNKALESYGYNKNVSEEIEIKILDDICNEESISKIDFLKIDVEGHEYKVLLGAQELLVKNKIRFIQFEFGPFNVYSRTYFKDFWDLLSPGYKIFRILTDGLIEIVTYNENLEIFRTSNFLAEQKRL